MKNQLDKAIRRVMAARHAEHRRAAVLVILALLTILSVSWRLHQVGIAMTDDEYSCGYEEHVHSDACYTEVLICGYEDGASETPADSAEEDGKTAPAAHSHTADCYQRVLTCTLPEHTHTLECLADITADVETPADWDEQSEGVSSFWSDAMTEIAQRQLGYTESAKNFTVDKALGETLAQAHHYTRYGDWYGNPYGSWDVMFVAFCQHYAGIPEDVIPQCASLLQLRTELENAHPEYITPGGSEATPGDIVLYTNAAGEETIGIVTAYDGANLTVVSGAVDGAVAAVTVAEADTYYTGILNENAKVYNDGKQDNKAYLEYSNNPHDNKTTNKTPEKVVYDWTFKMEINKIDGESNAPLSDAKFVLSKNGSRSLGTIGDDGTPSNTKDLISLIENSDGSYTVAPAGHTGTYVMTAGNITIKGLDDATEYYLYETKAPAGYNRLTDAVKFKITADYDETGKNCTSVTTKVNEDAPQAGLSITVKNNKGAALPSTGGIGTTIFYVIGGVLMAVAAVLLVTKKRMNNK